MTRLPRHARTRRALGAMLACAAMLVAPSAAQAACAPSVRADSSAAAQLVDQLRAQGSPAATDTAALYARARRSCDDLRAVRAIAAATVRLGIPVPGRRANVRGVPLVGTTDATGTWWRLDLKQLSVQVATVANRRRVAPQVLLLRSASAGSTARTFSADPTRTIWDPKVQALVATILGTSRHADARMLGEAGVRAFAVRTRTVALGRLPLLEHLLVANRIAAVGARSSNAGVQVVSSNVAVRAMVRIRAAKVRGWSKVDGAWSTVEVHRALVTQATVLVTRHPHARTKLVVDALRAALKTPATVDFGTLPVAAFYPWPRDGAFDTQAVSVDVDKPATVTLLVYGAGDTPVRSIPVTVDPGVVTLTWDGANDAGAIQEAGDYRYNIEVLDRANNRIRVPGLERFKVARDTTPPTVQDGSVRVVGSGASRRVVASWAVTEVHSPQVTTWVLFTKGEATERIQLHDSLQKATVRKPLALAAGTWTATLVFSDGSGNRVSRPAGTFAIR